MKKIFYVLLFVILNTNAQEMFKDFKINNIRINNKHENFGTAFYKDNSIVFSSETGGKLHLYSGEIVNGDVTNQRIFSKGSKNNTHESNVAFTSDFKTVYFTRSLFGKERGNEQIEKKTIAIFKATISSNGTWTHITPMPFNNKTYDVGHPTLNKENTKLYFSSNMPGGFGKTDIYEVNILSGGRYTEPENLGPGINTAGNELHPFISGDNFLYFSSNGYKEGLGGLDIFVSQVNENGVSKPEHVNSPINTRFDDFSFIIDYNKRIGFFSSNRPGGQGQDDIYYFKETINEVLKKEVEEKKKIEKKRECNQKVHGFVYQNASIKKIAGVEINLVNSVGEKIGSFNTSDDARYNFEIKCNEKYFIEASKDGYRSFTKSLQTNRQFENDYSINLYLVKFKESPGPEISKLKPGEVGFNFNETRLLKRYTYQLDKAILLLKDNPKLTIDIESHTDSRAEDEFNMNLTVERIEKLREYIAFKGISIRRIKGTPYGETKPLNRCVNDVECTEEEFLLNRRTTFILKEKK